MRFLGLLTAAAVITAGLPAAATVVTFAADTPASTLLAWGQARPILDPRSDPVTSGPVALGDGVTFSSTSPTGLLGYTGSYSFGGDGSWASQAKPMMTVNAALGDLILDFATPISAIVAQTNWSDLDLGGAPVTVSIFDDAHNLLETRVLRDGGQNLATPGAYIGFLRPDAEIGRIEFSNGYVGVRDFYSRYVSNPGPQSESAGSGQGDGGGSGGGAQSGGGWNYWAWYTHGGREWELGTSGYHAPDTDGPHSGGPGDPGGDGAAMPSGGPSGGPSDGPGDGPGGWGPPPFQPGAVPEPGTWTLMLLGFGAMGAMLRSSRRRAATA